MHVRICGGTKNMIKSELAGNRKKEGGSGGGVSQGLSGAIGNGEMMWQTQRRDKIRRGKFEPISKRKKKQ